MKPPLTMSDLGRLVSLLADGRWWAEGVRFELSVDSYRDGWWLTGRRGTGEAMLLRSSRVYLDARRVFTLSAAGAKGELLDLLDDAIRVIGYRLRESRPAGKWRLFGRPHPLHPMAARGMR